MRRLFRAVTIAAALSGAGGCATVETGEAAMTAGAARPTEARAHWLESGILVWTPPAGERARLVTEAGIIALEPSVTLEAVVAANHPHLAGQRVWSMKEPKGDRHRRALKGALAMEALDRSGDVVAVTGVQTGAVIDHFYATDRPLGARRSGNGWEIALWAPTARSVALHLFETARGGEARRVPMTFDEHSGVWSATGPAGWDRNYYLYEVEVYVPATGRVERNMVTDPYSLNLSANGERSQIVDLGDADLKPAGWDGLARDLPEHPEDRTVYELHVRDFSIGDEGIAADRRGRFAAFADPDAAGVRHLSGLAEAGLSDVHLLPTNDCASIEEREEMREEASGLEAYSPASAAQQALVGRLGERDGFNWCYDPLHYLAPEGSYASDPDGTARIREFREMVMGLDRIGLGTVLDVVFNHTPAHGQSDRAVLDRIVPGYYQRLDETGAVANSTCCSNTATERAMMERLMIDGLMVWARDYKVSGFRFDLMGHHSRDNILRARETLAGLTLGVHGVDGRDLLIYGEGWNFGEVADDARFVQASQKTMGQGSGIGTFNDRFRDAIRGGRYNSKGEDAIRTQGFASGLYTAPNALTGRDDARRAELLALADHVRAGLAGSLADYAFETADGRVRPARELDYEGQPVGYVSDPQETVNYAAAHDNPTLFDSNAWKLPRGIEADERVRWQNLATSLVVLAQGIPFIHAGQELLRTKSLDHNSYNSGDWFNAVDFSRREHGWGRGLAPRQDNEVDWPLARDLLADPRLAMGPEQIARASNHLKELLAIRADSSWLRMRTGAAVRDGLRFANTGPEQVPGLIVMMLGDGSDGDLMVVINATREAQAVDVPEGARYVLHDVQARSDDPVLRGAVAGSVPGLTTAVFVRR